MHNGENVILIMSYCQVWKGFHVKQYVVSYKFGRYEQVMRFSRLGTARAFVRELKRYEPFRWATITERSARLIETVGRK